MSEIKVEDGRKRRPRYLALADDLAEDIVAGRYPIGSMLPSETELCERYEVSRFTVREAIKRIQSAGLVSTRQGLGTRVEQIDEARHFSLSLKSIDEVEQHGHYTRLVDVVTRDIIADAALAETLSCHPGQQFLYIESYRVPRDSSVSLPVAWNESYIIGDYAGIRDEIGKHEGAVYSLLEHRFGDRITEIRQDISAINLDEAIALRLHVPGGTAGLRIKRSYIGRSGEPILYGINTYPGDRFTFSMLLNHRGEN
jgi:DNA-binding GntR family transcriptional regulator